jgi:DNA topoisomerase-2
VDHSVKELPICDFVNKELIHFAVADCVRSIPSLVDGLKPGQRKVLFTCLDKNLSEEIGVAQLIGSVSLHAAYYHGEESLNKAIVGMAHDFVGSNNINLLHPAGSFGSRLRGGKDAASPRYVAPRCAMHRPSLDICTFFPFPSVCALGKNRRYIHTRLSAIARAIFHPDDDKILDYLDDDGIPVEPRCYLPVLPMVLVNGAQGMGTGWSTNVPCHNARDVVDNIKRLLRNEQPLEMHPWYQGFEVMSDRPFAGLS